MTLPQLHQAGSAAGAAPAGGGTLLCLGAMVSTRSAGGAELLWMGKAAVLLALLGLEGQAARQRVAGLLWSQSGQGQARNNLRTLVHRINHRVGWELLVGAEQLAIDKTRVQVVLHDSQALLAALDAGGATRCELLADAGLDADADEALQAWLEPARQRLRRIQLAGLCEAVAEAGAREQHGQAAALARACVQLEPLSEHWHRQLMDTLARGGDRAAALAAYETCKAMLRHELGVLPDLQTRTVHLRILQAQGQAPRHATPPASAGLSPLGGAARYPLVEREAALGEAQSALAQGLHVVLQGEPGVGKTRLLRHLAAQGDVEQVSVRSGLKGEPYAAVAQWLQEVQPRRAPRIGVPEQIELARLAPLAFPGVQPSQAALSVPRLHAALRHWVARLGQAGVQWLVLDDVHQADAASQAAFGMLLGPPEGGPVLLLAHRSGETEPSLDEALVAAQAQRQARSLALQRLTLAGVQALLEAMGQAAGQAAGQVAGQGRPDAAQLAAVLLQRTGGNPLFVIELAQQALEPGGGLQADNLQGLLKARLARCSAPAQQLAAVAAVAAEDFSVDLAVAVTQQAALALMPAWSELQQRGLFADHGMAHDLVREAALAATPLAIREALHRQVAACLEGQGLQGAPVLRHWLAGQAHDQALPHAEYQLHATSAAGLSTQQQEEDLLVLLERVSDPVLLDTLWLTAEIDGRINSDAVSPGVWTRMAALVERVRQLPGTGWRTAAWVAFESARVHFEQNQPLKEIHAQLSGAVERMPAQGVERARAELFLTIVTRNLNGGYGDHVVRAAEAVAGLPADRRHTRLLNFVDAMQAMTMSPFALVRAAAAELRAARRRGDVSMVLALHRKIATTVTVSGRFRMARRHFALASLEDHGHSGAPQAGEPPAQGGIEGIVALNTGRYDAALVCFSALENPAMAALRHLFLALIAMRLGQFGEARACLEQIDLEMLRHQSMNRYLYTVLRSQLDAQDGCDPVPALRAALAGIDDIGIEGINRQLVGWQLARAAQPLAQRLAEGAALLDALRDFDSGTVRLPVAQLEVAEAHADADDPAGLALAREAAMAFRRGKTGVELYLPEALLRCARLLRTSEPAQAASLVHVARRWVLQALPHVPPPQRDSFMARVPVNRLLLADDEPAVYTAPLR